MSTFDIFWAPAPKVYFFNRDWTVGCIFMQFKDFLTFSYLLRSEVKTGNLCGNSYINFFMLDINFCVTCGEWNIMHDHEKVLRFTSI